MERGQALFVAGQYSQAAEEFEKGYGMHPYSAFLFNAGVAFEKSERLDEAIVRFKRYLEVDASAPDRPDVQKRVERLEQEIATRKAAEKSGKKANLPEASAEENAEESATKSLVMVETEPPGATIHFYQQMASDATYQSGQENPGFKSILSQESPTNVTLDVGKYHVVVDRFGNFNPSEADLEVLSGHLHQLKLSLSQGAIMAYLRVSVKPKHALVFLDDPKRDKAPWSKGRHGELVRAGTHQLLVVAPGYGQFTREVTLTEGQKEELDVGLERVDYGELRLESNASHIRVAVDGRPVGTWSKGQRPLEVRELHAGSHRVSITAPGRKPVFGSVVVPKGQVQFVHANMVITPPRGAAWTQAILSGVLLGGGVYLGLESNRLYDELSTDRSAGILVSGDSRKTRGKLFAIGADLALVGSGVLGGLAAYNFVRDPLPPSRLETGKVREFDSSTSSAPGGTQ